ncbi:MAG: AcvB/VirJ family lysyl-phosphatidylglycerol hydrolase [Micropepsaceae bacterium]
MSVIASLLAAALAAAPVSVKAAATYEPQGQPTALVVFLSGDGGWNLGVIGMAKRLASEGAAVAALDTPKLLAALDASAPDGCADLGGTIEAFAKEERAALHVPEGAPLILAGYSSGATAVYIAQAAMEKGSVRGSVALGFCPDMENKRPLCTSGGHADLTVDKIKTGYLYSPATTGLEGFTALQGMVDQVCTADSTIAFVGKIPGAKVVPLPKVGHGFGVEKNWMPQYLAAYREIAGKAE